jgi:hypothetical protein
MLTELVGINNIDTYQPRVRVPGKERKRMWKTKKQFTYQ